MTSQQRPEQVMVLKDPGKKEDDDDANRDSYDLPLRGDCTNNVCRKYCLHRFPPRRLLFASVIVCRFLIRSVIETTQQLKFVLANNILEISLLAVTGGIYLLQYVS